MMAIGSARKRRWILPASSWTFGGGAILFAAALIEVAFSSHVPVAGRVGSVTVSALLSILAWRLLRISLVITADGLHVRNLFRTYRLLWSEAESVDEGRYPFSAISIQRKYGATVRVSGLLTYLSGPTYRHWTKRRNFEIFQAVRWELSMSRPSADSGEALP